MNYCFNCGVKIVDKNQNFCIECGANLAEHDRKYANYKKDYRKKYNPMPGESYIEYLNRINAPTTAIPTDEEMEMKSERYRNYNPHEEKEPEIHYPASEREDSNSAFEALDDMISQGEITREEEPYRREIIREGMYGKPSLTIDGNYVREGAFGRPKYYIDGDIIRENNQFGRPAYRIDGNYIREGMYGRPKYYIDGDLIRENNQFGKVIGRKKDFKF